MDYKQIILDHIDELKEEVRIHNEIGELNPALKQTTDHTIEVLADQIERLMNKLDKNNHPPF